VSKLITFKLEGKHRLQVITTPLNPAAACFATGNSHMKICKHVECMHWCALQFNYMMLSPSDRT